MNNETIINYLDQPCKVACDRKCAKAWGINKRPKVMLSDDEDDFAWLADSELGTAPINPGTSEGPDLKPLSPEEFPNKWCVRECERCAQSEPGKWMLPLALPSFDSRMFNIERYLS